MKICLISFLIITTIYSCKESRPANVLPREKMEAVLWDYMKNDIYTFEYLKDSLHDDTMVNINLQKKIFTKNNVTAKEFNASFDYYTSKPKLLREILDSMIVHERRKDSAILKNKIVPVQGM